MKKSILALLLALCMLFSCLAGCANTSNVDDSASQPSENVSQNVDAQEENSL